MLKKMLAIPLIGLLFIMFLPLVGIALTLAEVGRLAYRGFIEAAARVERWAELS